MALPPFPSLTTPGAVLKGRWTANAGVPGNGASVTTWSDQSGNGKDLTAGTAPTFYSQRAPQARPLIEWDGTDTLSVAGSGAYFDFLSNGSAFTLTIVWRVRNNSSSAAMALLDTGANVGSSKGFRLQYDNNVHNATLRLTVTNGSGSAIVDAYLPDNVVPYYQWHCTTVVFDGATTYKVYEWGGLLGSIAAGVGYTSTGGALNVGANAGGSQKLTNGDIAELAVFSGAVNVADLNSLVAWYECVWHPAGNWTAENFLDGGPGGQTGTWAVSGLSFAVVLPTINGTPLLTGGTWDHDITEGTVIQFSPTDFRFWAQAADSGANINTTYYTSTDGLSWTRPNLGLVTYGGNTNNNIVTPGGYGGVTATYNLTGLSGQQYLLAANLPGDVAGYAIILGGNDGKNFSIVKNFLYGSSDVDANQLWQALDGRWIMWGETENFPHRNISMVISATSDLSGSWSGIYHAILYPSPDDGTNQFYQPNVQPLGSNLVMLAAMYDSVVTDKLWIDLRLSRDGGWSFNLCQTHYIPNTPSTFYSGTIFGANYVFLTGETRVYFQGGNQGHQTFPRNAALGYGTLVPNRYAKFSGFGSVTLRAVYQPDAVPTVNAAASGFKVTAACLDAQGNTISGYDDSQSTVVSSDTSGTTINWSGKGLPAQVTRLRFTMTH